MNVAAAEAEIDRGIAAVERAVYGETGAKPRTPFFRFPGFASSPALLERMQVARPRRVRRQWPATKTA